MSRRPRLAAGDNEKVPGVFLARRLVGCRGSAKCCTEVLGVECCLDVLSSEC